MSADLPLANELTGALDETLAKLRSDGLYRSRQTIETAQGPRVRIAGREYLSFASNDYLGLANDPRIITAACEGAQRHGIGAGASHLLSGHSRIHEALEAALADFIGYSRTLLFSTGYMANMGVVTALCGRDDEIFADRLNHASLNDAMVLSRARFRRYPHGDLDLLEHALARSRARRKLVITDTVFSMDGDIAPVPQLLALCERYAAFLLLDDAHGFGVLGKNGAGILSHFRIRSERVVYMGTLGKAAGGYGAFVAAEESVLDYLVNRARTYIYTTATPPLLAAALLESIRIVRGEHWRRERLAQWIDLLRSDIGELAPNLLPSPTPIQPYVLGSTDSALRGARALEARGLLIPAIRPPTVPSGSARLRISLSAGHQRADVLELVSALRSLSP